MGRFARCTVSHGSVDKTTVDDEQDKLPSYEADENVRELRRLNDNCPPGSMQTRKVEATKDENETVQKTRQNDGMDILGRSIGGDT